MMLGRGSQGCRTVRYSCHSACIRVHLISLLSGVRQSAKLMQNGKARMRLVMNRSVTPVDHQGGSSSPDWEQIHTFLETARRGSLRSAAETLKVSYGSVKRRIDELERQLGTKLFTRDVEGVRLTAEGKETLSKAEEMEGAFFGLMRTKERADPFNGEVKLATTEAFGTFWLAPTYIMALGSDLIRIDIGLKHPVEIWMTY